MHEPGGERGGEEPLAICVSGLLGVPEAHPPPGMGQGQSRGTPSSPAMMSRLRLHLRPLQLGGEKERVAAVGSFVGQLPHTLWRQILLVCSPLKERAGDPIAVMLPCSGCQVPGAGQAPQCQSPRTYVPAGLWVAVGQEFAPSLGLQPTPSRQLLPLQLHLLLKVASRCCKRLQLLCAMPW